MAEKQKTFAAPMSKTLKTKRPSTVSVAGTSRGRVPPPSKKIENPRPKNRNTTIIGDGDTTILKQECSMPDFDMEHRQIAYGKFLRAMLEECIVDEKIEREETQLDIQMSQLADRFQKTMDQLDKTNRRIKDINFIVEQNRLIDLRDQDCSKFYEMTDKTDTEDMLRNLSNTEQACLDRLQTKNVDFGYDKNTGHQQLLEAVNDAIDGLEQIKKHSNLDANKFKEYDKLQKNVEDIDKDRFDLESLKTDFDAKFPKFNERLLKEASEKIAKMIEADDD